MTNFDYYELFSKLIKTKVKKENIELSPTNNETLYSTIVESVKSISESLGYQQIEEALLHEYFIAAVKDYIAIHPVSMEPFSVLTKKGYKTWLTEERINTITWFYRERYLKYLRDGGRPEDVRKEIEDSSLDILGKLGDPSSGKEFYKKGLVVGSVQSGKTGNFNAVINSAIDAGYKIIIVLAGLYNDLRSQTQLRIEKDVIGTGIIDIKKGNKGKVGVGKITCYDGLVVNHVQSITSYEKDFEKALVDADFNPYSQTNILVCKKNTSVLKNLLIWLHDYLDEDLPSHKMPLLIIDDEADNASLNNSGAKGRNYASKINAQIRALLGLFEKKSYLGYTATPFANVLQDRNEQPDNDFIFPYKYKGEKIEKSITQVPNIFPDDFIVLLNPPSNYVGAKLIFDTIAPIENKTEEKIPVIEVIDDNISQFPTRLLIESGVGVIDYKNKEEFENNNGYRSFSDYKTYRAETRASNAYDEFPLKLPKSLKESIKCFLLTIAIREFRKGEMKDSPLYNQHHTMLIHVSRFTLWQIRTRDLVKAYISEIREKLENSNINSSIFKEFKDIWVKYYSGIMGSIHDYLPQGYVDPYLTPVSFETIQNRFLVDTVEKLDVKAINSITKETLEYPDNSPVKVIAIGGNRLSRGFTLEGLTVNYFIRNTNYSDTLLQMGRWFGYRPGYLDCCKLFSTQESIDKFNSTTLVIEELEGEFYKMGNSIPPKTPSNFEIRVRKHPGTLKITRPSILKNTKEVKWSYQDQLEMTTKFEISKTKISSVWDYFLKELAPNLQEPLHENGMLYYDSDINEVISILRGDNNYDPSTQNMMIKFLELCKSKNKLRNWRIALKTTGKAKADEGKGQLSHLETGLPLDVTLAVRSGPTSTPDKKRLLEDNIFQATGKSANIMTSPKDFSIVLTKDKIKIAEKKFIEMKIRELQLKNPTLSKEDARKKIKQIPERVYREKFSEQNGILIIYLFDTYYSLLQLKGSEEKEFTKFVEKNQINLEIPLVGYAIGFPPIADDPGGIYVQGDYDLKLDNEEESDFDDEDSELPDDSTEVVYDY